LTIKTGKIYLQEGKMTVNILGWLVLVALAVLFGWLAFRLWRVKNRFIKWAGVLLSALLTLVFALVSILVLLGMLKAYTPHKVAASELSVAMTPENIQRGEHLANSFCTSCHSTSGELPLTGGVDLGADFPIHLGTFIAPNLTPAGPLKDWTDAEIFAALREGVNPQGRRLVIMSNARVRYLSDEDTQAVIAYVRSQPAVDNKTQDPPDKANLLAMLMYGAGMIPEGLPPVEGSITAPPKGPTVAYGEYILNFQDCRNCHGADLKGGVEGQLAPIGWNLDPVKQWTAEQFITAMRTGVNPEGYHLKASMPWKQVGRMDDVELTAMHAYLASLP
jgi:mono/diheme cytochrome c family protein